MRQDFDARIADLVGPRGLITDPSAMTAYVSENYNLCHGRAHLVVRPADTAEVAAVVRLCAEYGVGMVPQGGNTGLCGGAIPDDSGRQIVVNLSRLNKIRAIDPVNFTITVEAGVVLQTLQQRADDAGCLFPLSLAAEGSCQIGGNISTNAGGTGVLRYGNTRDLVLGLEVVLPDGRIWDGLRALRKDNTGYDLKQVFIGGEGTLGIVTAAVLKLFPKAHDVHTAFCALTDLDAAVPLLSRARAASGDLVTACELVPRFGLQLATTHLRGVSDPFEQPHDWYVLLELATSRPDGGLGDTLESLLGEAFERGEVADAVIAASLSQRQALWRIREGLPEAQQKEGGCLKHDISVPTSRVPELIRRVSAAVIEAVPGVRPAPYGHIGDGNIHYNISQPAGDPWSAFAPQAERLARVVDDIVADMGGSFSAEHGIGQMKTADLARYKTPLEIELMRRVKAAFDPQGLMNPGKVV
jgi:D-lactate dehydrogenase (cytochrome)